MGKGYYEAHIPIPYLEFIWDMLHVGSTWYRSSSIPTFVGDASWLVVVRSCRWVVDEELRATSGEHGSTQHRLTWMEDDLSWRFGVVIRRALPNSLIYALCFPKKLIHMHFSKTLFITSWCRIARTMVLRLALLIVDATGARDGEATTAMPWGGKTNRLP
jgi:hypothetical protein